jgi:chromosome segregation ATPase
MLGYLANDIPPDDMITWLLLKDLVDHRIEMARYRRLKGALLQKVHNVRVQRNIAQLRTNLDAELKALRTQADRDCESLRRDVHDLQERQKKMGEVTAHLEAKLAATNEAYSQAIRRWEQHRATEQDLVNGLDDWIHDHQKIDRLL